MTGGNPAWRRTIATLQIVLAALLVSVAAARTQAQPGSYSESAVKAAFLYHFSSYVEWPAEDETAGITIAVIGDESVYDELATYLRGRTIEDRPVNVRQVDTVDELADDQVVFVGRQARGRTERIVEAAAAPGRLIVTDTRTIAPRAAINFLIVDDRVRFEISRDAVSAAGLMLSSRLLAAAFYVYQLSAN